MTETEGDRQKSISDLRNQFSPAQQAMIASLNAERQKFLGGQNLNQNPKFIAVDTGELHGPFLRDLIANRDDGDAGQHDVFFDSDHTTGPQDEHIEGEEGSGGTASSNHDNHLILSRPHFGYPTSDWKPQ